MIRSVAELLDEILRDQLPRLDASPITHGPTIGEMYEGLSADVLSMAIPEDLGLRVVRGFVTDGYGAISGQLDCMIVRGDSGQQVPFTDSSMWHVRDVIAVIEVKKALRKKEMREAIDQLIGVRSIESSYRSHADEYPNDRFSVVPAMRAFAETTRKAFPGMDRKSELPVEERKIWDVLLVESISIIRVALGLHGFATEAAFRKATFDILNERVGTVDCGPRELPQLMISGRYSLIKANGRPYSAPLLDGKWPFLLSTPVNPILVLLELIWTRIGEFADVTEFWGEDLETEALRALLFGRWVVEGWQVTAIMPTESELRSSSSEAPWEPVEVSMEEFVLLQNLCAGQLVAIDDPSMKEWLEGRRVDVERLFQRLLSTGLVALNGRELELIARKCDCAVLPDGRFVAAENNTGRLTRWIERYSSRNSLAETGGLTDG